MKPILAGQFVSGVLHSLAGVPPFDAPHRRVRFQRRRIAADRLSLHHTRFGQPLQNPGEHRHVGLDCRSAAACATASSGPAPPPSRPDPRNDRRLNHPPSLPRASRRATSADADARHGQAQGPGAATLATCTQRRMDRAAASSAQDPPSAAASSTARFVGLCRLAMPIPVDRTGNTTGIIGSPSPGMEKDAAIVVRPATSVTIRDGFLQDGVGGFRTPPAQRRPTPNRGRPALRAPFPLRLRSRPRPDDLAVRPARRIQQAPARTVGCEVDNRLVDQTFSRHLAPHVVIDPGPHERRPASGTSGPAGLL